MRRDPDARDAGYELATWEVFEVGKTWAEEENAKPNGTNNERAYCFLCDDLFGDHGVTALFLR